MPHIPFDITTANALAQKKAQCQTHKWASHLMRSASAQKAKASSPLFAPSMSYSSIYYNRALSGSSLRICAESVNILIVWTPRTEHPVPLSQSIQSRVRKGAMASPLIASFLPSPLLSSSYAYCILLYDFLNH